MFQLARRFPIPTPFPLTRCKQEGQLGSTDLLSEEENDQETDRDGNDVVANDGGYNS